MPPQASSQSENNTKSSLGSYDATPLTRPSYASRDPAKRPDVSQPSAPTLPSVASLTGYGMSAPSIAGSTDTGSPVSYRPLGVHSMLNHPADMELGRPVQRVSQSPGRSVSAAYPAHQTPIISPRVRKRKEEPSPGRGSQTSVDGRQGRRLLTPKSPSLRSISQSMRSSPSAPSKMSNLHSEGRVYTAEQADISAGNVPPLPPMSVNSHGYHGPIQLHEHPTSTGPSSHSNSSVAYSASNAGYVGSPSSTSNAGDREHTSPFRPSLSDSVPRSTMNQQPSATRAYGVGQTGYQMQISTDQGPMAIPVEIDLQQASKSADEKRKRNAGASARFRQRRKEKEQAASAHIADLQRDLRGLTEQRDHYRSERNFFRDMVARTPGTQLPPRPPSPQLRSGSGPIMMTPEILPVVDYGRRDQSEPSPAQRRRTNEYQQSFGNTALAPASYTPQYAPGPVPPPPQAPSYGLPPPSLPAPMQDPRVQPAAPFLGSHHTQQPPSSAPTATHRAPQADPFRREMNTR